MSILTRLMPDNPVLTKEMRVRMRGARAYVIMAGYLGFLSLLLLFQYASWETQHTQGAFSSAKLGADVFNWMTLTQLFLVLFITPAITSGALTIENEQRTMDMLRLTRIPYRSIILGKLLAGVLFTSLLIATSLPLISICFMLGSVDPAMVIGYFLMLICGSCLVGSIGLMWSSVSVSTAQAVLLTYVTMFPLLFCGSILFAINSTQVFTGVLVENLLHTLGAVFFGDQLFGLKGVNGLGFCVFCLLGTWLCGAVAMSRLEVHPERCGGLLRLATIVCFGVPLLAICYNWISGSMNTNAGKMVITNSPLYILFIPILILMLLIPIFATGEMNQQEASGIWKSFAAGFTPRGLRMGRMVFAPGFILLMTLCFLGIYCTPFVIFGKTKMLLANGAQTSGRAITPPPASQIQSMMPTQPVPLGSTITAVGEDGVVGIYTTTIENTNVVTRRTVNSQTAIVSINGRPILAAPATRIYGSFGQFPQAAITLLAFAMGLTFLCMALSLLIRNRLVAGALVYVLLGLILIYPPFCRNWFTPNEPPGIGVNLYSLDPLQSIMQMGGNGNYFNAIYMANRYIWLGTMPMWLQVTLCWFVIGAFSLLLIFWQRKRIALGIKVKAIGK